ncbi:MAG TPA: hypothetical protein VHO25_20350 [Polyangiaceae bacterium]|nr:hypothetical protein [Polyangiaceae bacterium]
MAGATAILLLVGCDGGGSDDGGAANAAGSAGVGTVGGTSGTTGGSAGMNAGGAMGAGGSAATARVCGDGSSTSYTIDDADDIAAIVDCTTMNGNLIVSDTMLTSLSLPNLVEIEGFFNCQLNPVLTSVSLPALTTTGHIAFSGNEELTSLNLSNLATAGGMTVFVNKLTSLSLPKLVSVALEFDFVVVSGTADPLTSLSLPELATVGSIFSVRHTLLLTELALPKLATVGDFTVEGNNALTNLTAPALATVQGGVRILSNPVLPTCQVQALLQQLSNFSGMTTIRDNDDIASCE